MPSQDRRPQAISTPATEAHKTSAALIQELEEKLRQMQSQLQTVNAAHENTVNLLQTAKAYVEKILHTIREALLILTPDLRIVLANQSFYTNFHVSPQETEGRLIYEVGNRQWDIPALHTLLEQVLPDNQVFNDFEVSHDFEQIGRRTMLLNARRLDHVQFILLAIEDITARKQAEVALRTSEAYFRQVWESTSDAMALSDEQGIVLAANPAYFALYGYTPDEVIGQSFALIFPKEKRAAAVKQYQAFFAAAATVPHVEAEVQRGDGQRRFVESRATFLHAPDGQKVILSTIKDITERKAAAAALQQAHDALETKVHERTQHLVQTNQALQVEITRRVQAEAQVRRLASTLTMAEQAERRRISQILHDDLQQLLYGIQMRTLSLMQDLRQTEPATLTSSGQELYDWLSDAIRLTRQLTVDLSPPVLKEEGVAEALRWLTRQMAETQGLTVEVRAASALPPVDEDMRVLLLQSVRELLFNVVKHAGVNEATVELRERAAGELLIAVSDQGQGFDVAAAEAAHDSGFGLFSVRERLALFDGQMTIDSAPGAGTTVTLALVTAPPTAASAG